MRECCCRSLVLLVGQQALLPMNMQFVYTSRLTTPFIQAPMTFQQLRVLPAVTPGKAAAAALAAKCCSTYSSSCWVHSIKQQASRSSCSFLGTSCSLIEASARAGIKGTHSRTLRPPGPSARPSCSSIPACHKLPSSSFTPHTSCSSSEARSSCARTQKHRSCLPSSSGPAMMGA